MLEYAVITGEVVKITDRAEDGLLPGSFLHLPEYDRYPIILRKRFRSVSEIKHFCTCPRIACLVHPDHRAALDLLRGGSGIHAKSTSAWRYRKDRASDPDG